MFLQYEIIISAEPTERPACTQNTLQHKIMKFYMRSGIWNRNSISLTIHNLRLVIMSRCSWKQKVYER